MWGDKIYVVVDCFVYYVVGIVMYFGFDGVVVCVDFVVGEFFFDWVGVVYI